MGMGIGTRMCVCAGGVVQKHACECVCGGVCVVFRNINVGVCVIMCCGLVAFRNTHACLEIGYRGVTQTEILVHVEDSCWET